MAVFCEHYDLGFNGSGFADVSAEYCCISLKRFPGPNSLKGSSFILSIIFCSSFSSCCFFFSFIKAFPPCVFSRLI
jgi:hypothetical protein